MSAIRPYDANHLVGFQRPRRLAARAAGLLRADMSSKPAYDALLKLVKHDWMTPPFTVKTDAAGKLTFRGFLGGYTARSAKGDGEFSLTKSGDETTQTHVKP